MKRFLLRTTAALAVLAVAALVVVWRVGPRYGIHLVPPTPQQYADQALQKMDMGYYAHGQAWQEARAKAVEQTRGAHSYAETLPALREALAVAGGKHSHLFDSGQTLSDVAPARPLPKVATADGITTLTVMEEDASDQAFKQKYASTLLDGIAKAQGSTSCGWIVDLRENKGGDMSPMIAGLSPLLPDGHLFGISDGTTTSWLELERGRISMNGKTYFTMAKAAHLSQPVAVLTGPMNGSSGEATVLSFKHLPGVRSFGQPTHGLSSANQTFRLYDGTQMLLTTGVDVDRTGHSYEGGPVPADQATTVDAAPAAAAAWLRSQCHR